MATTEHNKSVEKVRELIKDINIAMLTTAHSNGMMHSRPMGTQQVEFDGDLWFFTSENSEKAADIGKDKHVNLSYVASDGNRYVSVSGKANIVHNPKKVDELWNPIYKAWFPKGKEDPELVLLKVSVDEVEYWESPSSTVVKLVGFVKAVTTGHSEDLGENKTIKMHK